MKANLTFVFVLVWFFHTLQNIKFAELPKFEGTGYMRGMHGYDNTDQDMRGIFLAFGPGK